MLNSEILHRVPSYTEFFADSVDIKKNAFLKQILSHSFSRPTANWGPKITALPVSWESAVCPFPVAEREEVSYVLE